jgi:type I restriction enzyme S subunit
MAPIVWSKVPIVDLCIAHVDCVNRTAPLSKSTTEYKMIRTTNIKNGSIDVNEVRFVTEDTYRKWTRRLIPKKGDIILTREAPIGDVGKVKTDDKIFLGQRLYHFRPNPATLDSDFLLYSLQGEDLQAQIGALGSGSTVEHIKLEDIPSLLISLPPLPIQRRIAGILSAYDDLIEICQKRIKILETMARSLYREWFVAFRFPGHEKVKLVKSKLGMIPEGWEVNRLMDFCSLTMGQSPKSEFYTEDPSGLPFHQGVTNFGERFPEDKLFCTCDGRKAEAGDILFSVRAPVGRMNFANKRIILGRGLSAIRHRNNYQAFLWEQLGSIFIKDDMIGNGAIFASVTKSDMQSIELLVPDSAIVERTDRRFQSISSEIAVLSSKIVILRRTRDLLLPRLMSGKIDIS